MDSKMAVKQATRAALERGGSLAAKALETESVPARRLWKTADAEEVKELRVWELRDILPNAIASNPTAALDYLCDVLGLREAGVVVALAPRPDAGAHDLVVETAEASVAVANVQAKALAAASDGDVNPEEAADIERSGRKAERELVQVEVLARRFQAPQGVIRGAEVRP